MWRPSAIECVSHGGVGILLGNGDGSFGPMVNYPATGYDTARLAVGDLDGDSRADVVALNYQTADVSVLPGNGDGTLQAGTDYSVGGNPTESITKRLLYGWVCPDPEINKLAHPCLARAGLIIRGDNELGVALN